MTQGMQFRQVAVANKLATLRRQKIAMHPYSKYAPIAIQIGTAKIPELDSSFLFFFLATVRGRHQAFNYIAAGSFWPVTVYCLVLKVVPMPLVTPQAHHYKVRSHESEDK